MARSAEMASKWLARVAPAIGVVALTGCATTQQEAARLQLNSARERAAQLKVEVTRSNPDVIVQSVELVTARGGSAFVVRLKNAVARPVSDLPISVGVSGGGGRRRYLNAAPSDDYFVNHIPAIPAGGGLTWVFTTHRVLGARSSERPFALVGVEVPPVGPALKGTLPTITAAAVSAAGNGVAPRRVRVVVRNLSSVPQYGLQVYLVASRAGRYLGAGRATVAHLGGNSSAALQLRLVGRPQAASITLEASPTIYG